MSSQIFEYDIWSSTAAEVGLSEEDWKAECKWVKDFNEATDTLDWELWKEFWTEDAFFKFAGYPRLDGREQIGVFLRAHFAKYKMMEHRATRHTYDLPRGIIYQGLVVTSVVKDDPEDRLTTVLAMNILYRRPGESQIRGMEIFTDMSPMEKVYQDVMTKLGKW
ncbi:hypothetical protein CTheo_6549 [Ceratobasidium theobromae]|uniref:SnoaL-like domain-containing protein n=1 Tax=Ceratobasidium theobromae TaxID=1582974 RepID=A0A5N5QEC9_9AGAM|nr:hypothetical protein CTheo_6549 [Ceratobasidium theobromae]